MNKNIEINQDFGYGIIPKKIMRDKSLFLQAKAIYSYLASFAENNNNVLIRVETITEDLRIGRDTYFKYLKELKDKGFIKSEQVCNGKGKFIGNKYYLPLNNIKGKEENYG